MQILIFLNLLMDQEIGSPNAYKEIICGCIFFFLAKINLNNMWLYYSQKKKKKRLYFFLAKINYINYQES